MRRGGRGAHRSRGPPEASALPASVQSPQRPVPHRATATAARLRLTSLTLLVWRFETGARRSRCRFGGSARGSRNRLESESGHLREGVEVEPSSFSKPRSSLWCSALMPSCAGCTRARKRRKARIAKRCTRPQSQFPANFAWLHPAHPAPDERLPDADSHRHAPCRSEMAPATIHAITAPHFAARTAQRSRLQNATPATCDSA